MLYTQKQAIGFSAFIAVMGVGLIVAAFATDNWIDSDPRATNASLINATAGMDSKYTGNITFGLFTGYKSMDYGVGSRVHYLYIKCDMTESLCTYFPNMDPEANFHNMIDEYKNQTGEHEGPEMYGLFSFPMYVSTLVLLILAMVWGLIAIGFAVFNVFGRPIETVTGPAGLYIWNTIALLCTAGAIGVYLGLYFTQLNVNILFRSSVEQKWTSKDRTYLDYSFYFVVGAGGAFIMNIIILMLSKQKLSCSYSRSGEKEVDNGMILY